MAMTIELLPVGVQERVELLVDLVAEVVNGHQVVAAVRQQKALRAEVTRGQADAE